MASAGVFSSEHIQSGRRETEKLNLTLLQSKMKCDPEGYESELLLIYDQFRASLSLMEQHAALHFSSTAAVPSDSSAAKDLSERVLFLAHLTPFYPITLSLFPKQIADFIKSSARSLPSFLRCSLAQALILLVNRKMVDIEETLPIFMELQTLGDKHLRKLVFSHVVHSIRRMNKIHKNEAKNRAIQNILFSMAQEEGEMGAKRALIILCNLHKRKVWFDDRTANAICRACFHPSTKIVIVTLSFLLDYEKIEACDDSDCSSSEDDIAKKSNQVILNRETVYKATHKGTVSSKKKKKAKLERIIRSMRKQQRIASGDRTSTHYTPLNQLNDAQGFAEKLFSSLRTCREKFEVKVMMLKVIATTIGLHKLILLKFYSFLVDYVKPHQRDITELLAATVHACHDMVPSDAVEPLFKQLVNQFVHDRSRPEAISVGINVVREICLRMPLLMTEELLQDLALYKKSNDKGVTIAARSLISLFREVCPSMLVRKDRGRPIDSRARPRAFGETNVEDSVPGIELLHNMGSSISEDASMYNDLMVDDCDGEYVSSSEAEDEMRCENGGGVEVEDMDEDGENDDGESEDCESEDGESEDAEDSIDGNSDSGYELESVKDDHKEEKQCGNSTECHSNIICDDDSEKIKGGTKKRKRVEFSAQFNNADLSLRSLRKLVKAQTQKVQPPDTEDGILSNEDFLRIRELKDQIVAETALGQNGMPGKEFRVPNSEHLSLKRVDPAKLEIHVKKKLTKDEKLALIRAGREDRVQYQSRTASKQKKSGGSSNRQKENMKQMPTAAKRIKAGKSRDQRRKKQRHSGKQFRGRKAWK